MVRSPQQLVSGLSFRVGGHPTLSPVAATHPNIFGFCTILVQISPFPATHTDTVLLTPFPAIHTEIRGVGYNGLNPQGNPQPQVLRSTPGLLASY